MRKGNPHLDERELDRLGKIGDPFSTWRRKGMSKRHKQHKQASAMWKKHMRQKVKP